METIISEIDARISLYKGIILDKVKKDGAINEEIAEYSGIVKGLEMVKDMIRSAGDDGK